MPNFETPSDLSPGDGGEDVTLLQQFLIVLDYMPGPEASGTLDEETATAVASFKAGQGLGEDAAVDGDTWAALFTAVGPAPVDSAPTFSTGDYPALAQVFAYGAAGEGAVDVEGYIVASLDVT